MKLIKKNSIAILLALFTASISQFALADTSSNTCADDVTSIDTQLGDQDGSLDATSCYDLTSINSDATSINKTFSNVTYTCEASCTAYDSSDTCMWVLGTWGDTLACIDS